MTRPEILAPAGSIKAMEAAVKAGADAVYMGGSMFGARAYADNPDQEELVEAIRYVHFYDKKLYLTLNTLLKEEEMGKLGDYLLPYYEAGLDGIIIQDPGVFSFIKRNFPGLPLHASTQMNLTGIASAKLLKEAGASRIVPARELSLREISQIKKETGLEIECFVHGALCYCYSGRCLMSSVLGGRSGNRGRCAQPCRLPYEVSGSQKSPYVLSPKDLNTISYLPELVQAGIDSFKIEGRMKNPEYVAAIVSVYRRYLDAYLAHPDRPYHVAQEDQNLLLEAYNRGGFTAGYYEQKNGPEMMSMKRPNHRGIPVGTIEKLKDGQIYFHPTIEIHKGDGLEILTKNGEPVSLTSPQDCRPGQNLCLKAKQTKSLKIGTEILRTANPWQKKQLADQILTPVKKRNISGRAEFFVGKPARLTLWLAEENESGNQELSAQSLVIEGETVLQAQDRPLTREQIEKPLLQTGTSRFAFEHLDIFMDEQAFLPMGAIKKLRREGLETYQTYLEERFLRKMPQPYEPYSSFHETDCPVIQTEEPVNPQVVQTEEPANPQIRVSAEDSDKLMMLLCQPEVDSLYVPLEALEKEEREALVKKSRELEKPLYYSLPRVFRNQEQDEYTALLPEFLEEKPAGFLVRNVDELAWVKEHILNRQEWKDTEVILDHSLYAYNREARSAYVSLLQNAEKLRFTLPLELNKKELSNLLADNPELIVYGRIPLMVSAQCVQKNTKGCVKTPGYLRMTDRYKKPFYVRRHCRHCYNTVWNGVPLSFHGMSGELRQLRPASLRLHFTVETEEEIKHILQSFFEEWKEGNSTVGIRGEFTRGHYKRGVE
jgi:putative protease